MQEQNILLPSKLKIVEENETTGIYEVEGLHPGYGHTLGNSLRRIMLSSLPGSAVTQIRIEGAKHEFSTLDGVREDVLNIILNMKRVRFRLETDEPQEVKIEATGVGKITAKDLVLPGGVTVANPDEYIAEVTDKKASLSLIATIQRGLGYVPKEMMHTEKMPIGTLVLDAVFSPIRKVSYEVEDMRVGERTDYNRLRISVQTDGTIAAKEALEHAITTMVAQMTAILDLKDIEESIPRIQNHAAELMQQEADKQAGGDSEENTEGYADLLKTRIDTLSLSARTMNSLVDANIRTIGGLVNKTQDDILALDGIGEKGLDEVVTVLTSFELALKEA